MADGYEEFEEEEVWAVMKDRKDGSPKGRKSSKESISSAPRRLSSASRMIPKSTNGYGETGVGGGGGGRGFQQSAPVNIPDWSKIYKKKNGTTEAHSFKSWHRGGMNGFGGDHEQEDGIAGYFEDDDEGEEDEDRIPPHEWIAKKLARSQISPFSVFEGAGRTLKGRDLSKVRNAVLTRTGFLE